MRRWLEIAAVLGLSWVGLRIFGGPQLGWHLSPHPLWIPLALLIAHDAMTGLIAAVLGWIVIAGALVAQGVPSADVIARLESPAELLATMVLIALAAVSGLKKRQLQALRIRGDEQRMDLERLHREIDVWAQVVGELRSKLLRMDISVTFLRDVAQRLDGREPEEIAAALLDFAMARTGARTGAVRVGRPGHWRLLVSVDSAEEGKGAFDRTVDTAIALHRTIRKMDLPNAAPTDCDLATPLFRHGGEMCIGMLVLRDIPSALLHAVDVDEMSAMAAWAAASLERANLIMMARHGSDYRSLWEEADASR